MKTDQWRDAGSIDQFKNQAMTEVSIEGLVLAISNLNGKYGAISGVCNHVGGPLGQGRLDGEYVICPWHQWKFHCQTGLGEPGYEKDAVPRHDIKVENGHLWVNLNPATKRTHLPHPAHPLSREPQREPGPIRMAGISTTVMDRKNPRYSTSEALLQISLDHAASELGCETKLIRLDDLKFQNCKGYYSKSAHACIWPCSITQMDKTDEMEKVYDAMVFWADVIILSTPIRWGQASSLFFKMAERLNCVQNQITINDNVLIRNKVASFIITGGQDNIQGVAGNLLAFFSEIGFMFPQFPFIAHSRGWSAEDMENNVDYVMGSQDLRDAAKDLARRSVEHSKLLLGRDLVVDKIPRGGRKAHKLDHTFEL
jgi:nitrite reductase/ring-hydroxylating ferredoxin subunit/multimeric flavodoxin WrbA